MKKIITTILFIGILSSCSSVKNSVAKSSVKNIADENIELLNGIYKNSSPKPNMKFTSLWSVLNYEIKKYPNWEQLIVRIQIDENDKKSVNLSLLDDNNNVVANSILKGKIGNNYFLFKKQTKAKLLVFILVWGIGNSSVKIALSEQNELIVLSKTEGVGLIVAVPGFASGGQLKEHKFEKIK